MVEKRTMEERERWWKMGLKAISDGKLGILLLSGGQVCWLFVIHQWTIMINFFVESRRKGKSFEGKIYIWGPFYWLIEDGCFGDRVWWNVTFCVKCTMTIWWWNSWLIGIKERESVLLLPFMNGESSDNLSHGTYNKFFTLKWFYLKTLESE